MNVYNLYMFLFEMKDVSDIELKDHDLMSVTNKENGSFVNCLTSH